MNLSRLEPDVAEHAHRFSMFLPAAAGLSIVGFGPRAVQQTAFVDKYETEIEEHGVDRLRIKEA